MNPASDTEFPPALAGSNKNRAAAASPPANWSEALAVLAATRLALIELEFKHAAQAGARRASCFGALLACVFFMWALLLAGGIAVLAQAVGWPWYWIAIGGAALHLVAASCLAMTARAAAAPAFPITRAEFQKDLEWIENLQQSPKSSV